MATTTSSAANSLTYIAFDRLGGSGAGNTSSDGGFSGKTYLYRPGTAARTMATWEAVYGDAAATSVPFYMAGAAMESSTAQAIVLARFLYSTGNIASGTIDFYGVTV